MPSGIAVHKLSQLNLEELTATCAKCGPNSSLRMKDGKPRCKNSFKDLPSYKKNQNNTRLYGLPIEEAKQLRKENPCAICGSEVPDELCIDHDHVTGKARGVLCRKCNSGLGLFEDNTDYLARAIEYLTNPPLWD